MAVSIGIAGAVNEIGSEVAAYITGADNGVTTTAGGVTIEAIEAATINSLTFATDIWSDVPAIQNVTVVLWLIIVVGGLYFFLHYLKRIARFFSKLTRKDGDRKMLAEESVPTDYAFGFTCPNCKGHEARYEEREYICLSCGHRFQS